MRATKQETTERFWRALRDRQPATSEMLVFRSGLSLYKVRALLREGLRDGTIKKRPWWLAPNAYTWVYEEK